MILAKYIDCKGMVEMKYIVILGTGWLIYPCLSWVIKPSNVQKPNMDSLARRGEVGLVRTVPKGMPLR